MRFGAQGSTLGHQCSLVLLFGAALAAEPAAPEFFTKRVQPEPQVSNSRWIPKLAQAHGLRNKNVAGGTGAVKLRM